MIRVILFASLVAFFLQSATGWAQETPFLATENLTDFLQDVVIGKTVVERGNAKIDEGKVETEIVIRTTYANLQRGNRGLSFDAILDIHQSNFDLSEKGERTGKGEIKDRSMVLRYTIGQAQSTGKLIGYSTITTSTTESYSASSLSADLIDGRLIIRSTSVPYIDGFAKGGRFKPISVDRELTFTTLEDASGTARLAVFRKTQGHDVDPETLQRTGSDTPVYSVAVESGASDPQLIEAVAWTNQIVGGKTFVRTENDGDETERISIYHPPFEPVHEGDDFYYQNRVTVSIETNAADNKSSVEEKTIEERFTVDDGRVMLTEITLNDEGKETSRGSYVVSVDSGKGLRTSLTKQELAEAKAGDWIAGLWTWDKDRQPVGLRFYKDSDRVDRWEVSTDSE